MEPDMEQSESQIIQNLKDAGCSQDTIAAFVEDIQVGNLEDGMRVLGIHRNLLLDGLHQKQREIDCLDYLLYQMRRNSK